MKLIILLTLTTLLQAKECDIYLNKALSDLNKSYIGDKKSARTLKTMYATRSIAAFQAFNLCIDAKGYTMSNIEKAFIKAEK